jgi:hypothetical protein
MHARIVERHGVLNMVDMPSRPMQPPVCAYLLSLTIAVLVAATSMLGLAASGVYQRDPVPAFGIATSAGGVLVPGFAAHDLFNLMAIAPLLLVTLWFARRGRSEARLLWPGVLFYTLYTYMVALVGSPFGALFVVHGALVVASASTILVLLTQAQGVTRVALAPRAVGGILIALAALTAAQDLTGVLVSAQSGAEPLGRRVWTADFVLEIPALLIGGVLLWRRLPLGYAAAPGLLLQFGLTPLALGLILAAQPALTGSTLDVGTTTGVLLFSCAAFAPLVWIARGEVRVDPLWAKWVAANVVGEIVGFGLAAVAGAVLLGPIGGAEGLFAALLMLLGILVIGGLEGSAVGLAQWHVLRGVLPALRRGTWLAATVAGAVLAWGAGMALGPAMGDGGASGGSESTPMAMLAGAAIIGIVAGILLSTAQWLVLQRFVRRAIWWVPAHALGWAMGMLVAFAGVSFIAPETPMTLVAAIGAATGLLMGAVVSAITGIAVVRLVHGLAAPRGLVRTGVA